MQWPALERVGDMPVDAGYVDTPDGITLVGNVALADLSFPALTSAASIQLEDNPGITTLVLPRLTGVRRLRNGSGRPPPSRPACPFAAIGNAP